MRAVSVADIGRIVAAARRARKLTQAQLARAVGASQHWISEVEAGKPSAQIGKVLGVLVYLGVRLQVGTAPWLTGAGPAPPGKAAAGVSLDNIIAAHSTAKTGRRKTRP